ncbi:MAG: Tryptophan 2,3-dioxygenase apoenzyme / Tryptophan 2,3-dioxygenase holoenzyme [Frankiales bacterium]|nr:Tryptophan 2,3-dioxygenase apoenzyme / Tryptophan 2,3-dioxygenase holoenzyme [Frankiales bacterium]
MPAPRDRDHAPPGDARRAEAAPVKDPDAAPEVDDAVPDAAAARPAAPDDGGAHFGEQGGRLSYASYLRLPDLLAQQVTVAEPVAHDERLFITVHQVYELWFAQCLHELGAARDAMLAGDAATSRRLLVRVHVVERVLLGTVEVLETMTPQDFLAFRNALAPASGFQSVQYRELEFLSGARDPTYLTRMAQASPAERAALQRRLDEPSLWEAFLALLSARGLPVEADDDRRASLLAVARERADLWDLAEALLEHDALSARWRSRHVDMVERQIGTRSGTGGSSGAPYLRSRLALRYFPELWDLRSEL